MSIIVQKYGGTSLRNKDTRGQMYKHMIRELKKKNKIIVIVSAMGRYNEPYATDTLLSVVEKDYLNDEELDRLLSLGETLSVLVCKSELKKMGYQVESLSNDELGIITDDQFNHAVIQDINKDQILFKLNHCDILICPGFQGHTLSNKITTLGRGGSDLTAIALAIALKTKEVEIYSDVDGVYDANPQQIQNAKKVNQISFIEMLEYSLKGASVLESKCVLLASYYHLPIHLRNTFTNEKGTYIKDYDECSFSSHFKGIASILNKSAPSLEKLETNQHFTDYPYLHISCDKDKKMTFHCLRKEGVSEISLVGEGFINNHTISKVCSLLLENHISLINMIFQPLSLTCFIDSHYYLKSLALLYNAFIGEEKK